MRQFVTTQFFWVCAIILLALAVAMDGWFVFTCAQAMQTWGYHQTTGRALRPAATPSATAPATGMSSEEPAPPAPVKYWYMVEGQQYTGTRVNLEEASGTWPEEVANGAEVAVFFDPQRPENAVLERGGWVGLLWPAFFLAAVNAAGALLLGLAVAVYAESNGWWKEHIGGRKLIDDYEQKISIVRPSRWMAVVAGLLVLVVAGLVEGLVLGFFAEEEHVSVFFSAWATTVLVAVTMGWVVWRRIQSGWWDLSIQASAVRLPPKWGEGEATEMPPESVTEVRTTGGALAVYWNRGRQWRAVWHFSIPEEAAAMAEWIKARVWEE